MDAMSILRSCRKAEQDKERLEQLIAQRREVLDSLSGPRMDPNGGGKGSPDPDKTGRIVADIDELERKLQQRRDEHEVEKVAVTAMMDWLPIVEGKVLHKYYVSRMTTGEIAKAEHYKEEYIRKIKSRGERLLKMVDGARVDELAPRWYRERREEG